MLSVLFRAPQGAKQSFLHDQLKLKEYLVKPRLVWALAPSELFTCDLAVLRINNEFICMKLAENYSTRYDYRILIDYKRNDVSLPLLPNTLKQQGELNIPIPFLTIN